jgi:acyl-CoA thioester hydrolase
MARVRFDLQGRKIFRTRIRVRVDDVNYGGHLGNDSVLTLCHEARIRFFAENGQSEMNLFGKSIIMTDAMVLYKSEGNWGDDIEITLSMADIGRRGFDLYYLLECGQREIARVKTGIAFFDYRRHKITTCPEGFVEKFTNIDDGEAIFSAGI